MANEATVRSSLTINKGNVNYTSRPGAFQADVATASGGKPGEITAAVDGTDVDVLSILTDPGLYRIQNLDETNFVRVGIRVGTTFRSIHRILPGESYVARFDDECGLAMDEPGTGTAADNGVLNIRADTAACKVLLEAYEA